MAKYQIVRIDNKRETLLLDTDKKAKAIDYYHYCRYQRDNVRIRVDGELLLIHEADKLAGLAGCHVVSRKRKKDVV